MFLHSFYYSSSFNRSSSLLSSSTQQAATERPQVDKRTGKSTGISFLPAETIARAEKGDRTGYYEFEITEFELIGPGARHA